MVPVILAPGCVRFRGVKRCGLKKVFVGCRVLISHDCLLGVPIVGRDQYDYMSPAFLVSPWWGKINMATSPWQKVWIRAPPIS